MTFIARLLAAVVLVLLIGAALVWSGVYDVGADDPHTAPVKALLNTARMRSVEVRAAKIEVPDLADPQRIVQGAGNYDAMCVGCHLAPGMAPTELSRGLYPEPPNLTKINVEPAHAFWVIKHGIKASGMPAWGKSMADEYIWNMTAFLQTLPNLNQQQYGEMVASSGGHSHGETQSADHHSGKETKPQSEPGSQTHTRPEGGIAAKPHAQSEAGGAAPAAKPSVHIHADGKRHEHPAPAVKSRPAPQHLEYGQRH